jgi:hypothetical protein
MERILVAVAAVVLAGCAQITAREWQTLLDGDKGLENFNRVGDANWRAENGAIVADRGKGGFLVTKGTYRDFEIRAEFWAEADTNSGIYFRCSDAQKVGGPTCYEANVWDNRPDPKYGTGALMDVAAVPVPILYRAAGRWNTLEVAAKGTHLVVKLNGVTTADANDAKHTSGYIGLQYGPGAKGAESAPIKWRRVQVRPL